MVKDQEFLKSKASYCLDLAKKMGATDASVKVGHSISETVNFRNKKLDESDRSDNLGIIFPIVEIPRYTDYYGSVFLKENKKVPKDSFSVPFGHSYCFHLTKKGFDCLYEKDFFQLGELDKEKAILKYERILTSYILNEGLKVKGLNEPFNELDLGDSKIWDSRHFCLSYFETTDPENLGDGSKENIFKLNPYQVRFIKNIKLPHIYRPLHLSGISEELQKEIDYLISNFNH